MGRQYMNMMRGFRGLSLSQPDRECFAGEWRRPHNDLREQHVGGGHKAIHDDETAAKVGFDTGAPIHGTVHWSQFTPLLLQLFGPAWFETGSISVHFITPVAHLQPVRAFMAYQQTQKKEQVEQQDEEQHGKQQLFPSPQQKKKKKMIMDIWMEHINGRVVLKGTASVGLRPNEMMTMAKSRIRSIKPYTGALIFVRHDIGTQTCNVETACIDFDKKIGPLFPFTLNEKLQCITEWHPWFAANPEEMTSSMKLTKSRTSSGSRSGNSKSNNSISSPWNGRPILPPEALNALMLSYCGTDIGPEWPDRPQDHWLKKAMGHRTPVSLFGGCEVIYHNGPAYVGQTYKLIRILIAKGETPKTEFSWVKTILFQDTSSSDRQNQINDGNIIAEMTLQTMYLKGSFEGYNKLRDRSNNHEAQTLTHHSKL